MVGRLKSAISANYLLINEQRVQTSPLFVFTHHRICPSCVTAAMDHQEEKHDKTLHAVMADYSLTRCARHD